MIRSILDTLARIPCVDSLKVAQTIIDELGAQGYSIVESGYDNSSFPNYPDPLRPDAYPKRKPHSAGILRQKVRGLDD